MTLRTDPGILLRVIRSGKHTQASLARELGVRNIGMWMERGVPDRWLAPMATALGMTERRLCRILQEATE